MIYGTFKQQFKSLALTKSYFIKTKSDYLAFNWLLTWVKAFNPGVKSQLKAFTKVKAQLNPLKVLKQ